jgi:hypothetical protein
MKRLEYNCVEVVMDDSKNAAGLEEFHKTFGALGWKLIDSFKTREALGRELRMFTYMRESNMPSPSEVKAMAEIEAVLNDQPRHSPNDGAILMLFGLGIFLLTVLYIVVTTH